MVYLLGAFWHCLVTYRPDGPGALIMFVEFPKLYTINYYLELSVCRHLHLNEYVLCLLLIL